MTIYAGLAAHRVRPDAEPTYVHEICKHVLREYPVHPDADYGAWVLKCDVCGKIVGEWPRKDEMSMELQLWWEMMHNGKHSMKQTRKNRFSPGRRVLVGVGMKPGTVKWVADLPSVMGEFVHEVLLDGNDQPSRTVGCDLQPIPELDEDLQERNQPSIHIQNSNVANLNVGTQVGTINAALQSLSETGDAEREVARAIKELTDAVVSAQTALPEPEKQEIVQALSTIAEQAAKKPDERSKGTLKAVATWIPTAIAAASNLVSLWEKVWPTIRSYFGI